MFFIAIVGRFCQLRNKECKAKSHSTKERKRNIKTLYKQTAHHTINRGKIKRKSARERERKGKGKRKPG